MATDIPRPAFEPGRNIAVKVPDHEYRATVVFYRDVLGYTQIEEEPDSVVFAHGDQKLWVDRVAQLSQAEVWLEVRCADAVAAARYLDAKGVARRDGVEPLPEGFAGFWIASPANVIHLVAGD